MQANTIDKADEISFALLQMRFRAELIGTMAQHVSLTLTSMKQITCAQRNNMPPRETTLVGPLEFRLIAARVVESDTKPPRLTLRLEPKQREEYRYAEFDEVKDMAAGFAGTFMGREASSWEEIYERMLEQREPTSKLSYGELIKRAVDAERDRVMKLNIQSHADFGSW